MTIGERFLAVLVWKEMVLESERLPKPTLKAVYRTTLLETNK